MSSTPPPSLARRLGTGDAVVVGMGAMLGAGVFVVFAPAAQAAGAGLLIALAIAAVVAFCNATASAQLAAAHPSSGGTYHFGRQVLGERWGFVAGWGFVLGKTASCAVMAGALAAYALPPGLLPDDARGLAVRVLAALAVVALTWANLRGVQRTALLTRILLALTLLALGAVAATLGTSGERASEPWTAHGGALGVLQAAGLLFFAFAGYARIATLAEEVRRPAMLGRAVVIALGAVTAVYAVLAVLLLLTLGDDLGRTGDGGAETPLAQAVAVAGAGWLEPLVRVGAVAACLGALLGLLAGVGRTTLAMARGRDLPAGLASISSAHRVPDRAQIAIAAAVVLLVAVADLRATLGVSSFGVLVYYAVTNAAALRQPAAQRRWPRALHVLGLAGCVVLALTLPPASAVVAGALLAAGLAARELVRRAGPGSGARTR